MLQPFPTDWRTALVLVPHPDDPEYGIGAAVAKQTARGKTVHCSTRTPRSRRRRVDKSR